MALSARGQQIIVGALLVVGAGSLAWSLANRYSVRDSEGSYLPPAREFLRAAIALDSNRLVQLGAGPGAVAALLKGARERPLFLASLAKDMHLSAIRHGDRTALFLTAPDLKACNGSAATFFSAGAADTLRIDDVRLECPEYPARDSVFRTGLLERVARDQAIRDTLTAAMRDTGAPPVPVILRMNAIDSANLVWLKPELERRGWPTAELIGADGVEAAFLLVQHADTDPDFQERMLPLLSAAHGRGEVKGENLALLTDRVAKARGRPQRFGTQTTIRDGRVVVDPIEDSVNVDTRRAAMGLPSLAIYKLKLDSIFTPAGGSRRKPPH